MPDRKADNLTQACIDLFSEEVPQSTTFDNGKKLAQHKKIATTLKTEVFFANPYHSWERGTNEKSLNNVSDEFVQAIEYNLNNRPRKVLGYQIPLEVRSRFGRVALQT